MSIAWFLARPKLAIAILLTVALACWHWQDKISDWFDAKKIARLERENAALLDRVASLEKGQKDLQASIAASDAARSRNDEVIPETRRATAGRVSRAGVADDAQRVLDVQGALDGYASSANRL